MKLASLQTIRLWKKYSFYGFFGLVLCGLTLPESSAANPLNHKQAATPVPDSSQKLRIVALAPHSVEMLFSLQLGEYIVGTSEFADYPEAAKQILRIANHQTINFEQLVALQPTHIIVWKAAISAASLQKLQSLHIPIFISDPNQFSDISKEITQLGHLFHQESRAKQLAQQFNEQLRLIKQRYVDKPKISVMYVLWPQPLMVAGSGTWVSQYMQICGANNSFAAAKGSYPQISMEQVLINNPALIIESRGIPEASRINWSQWQSLQAVQQAHITQISPDTVERATLRSLQGLTRFCALVDSARNN